MSRNTGYDVYFDSYFVLPFAPSSLEIQVGSRNETVTLINQGEINLLKSPSLTEVTFEMRLPQQQYPFARSLKPVKFYHDILKDLKTNKKSFQFIVVRTLPDGTPLFDTNLTMALEEYTMKEDAEEGFDVIFEITLKAYKSYGAKTATVKQTSSTTEKTVNVSTNRGGEPNNSNKMYTVKSGDCLYNISIAMYGTSSRWREIYNANKSTIESVAKSRGKKSSSNGHWIFPGTQLVIP